MRCSPALASTLWRSRKGGRRPALCAAGGSGACVPRDASFRDVPVRRGVRHHPLGARVRADPQLGAPHENVSFTTSDGLRLHGWFVPSNGATVISFPGRKGPQKPARLLVSEGYGVLLFDRRGEGESDGDPNALGWRHARSGGGDRLPQEPADVDPDRIGGVGLSVGGEMMLQAAAERTTSRRSCPRARGPLGAGGGHMDGAEKVGSPGCSASSRPDTAVFTSDLPPPSLTDLSAEITEPVLFIRDTRPGRRDADREVLRGGDGPEGVLGRSGRAHRARSTPRRRSTSAASSGSSTGTCSAVRPDGGDVAHSVCHDAAVPEPGKRRGACDDRHERAVVHHRSQRGGRLAEPGRREHRRRRPWSALHRCRHTGRTGRAPRSRSRARSSARRRSPTLRSKLVGADGREVSVEVSSVPLKEGHQIVGVRAPVTAAGLAQVAAAAREAHAAPA